MFLLICGSYREVMNEQGDPVGMEGSAVEPREGLPGRRGWEGRLQSGPPVFLGTHESPQGIPLLGD